MTKAVINVNNDDPKAYAKNSDQLKGNLEIIKAFSDTIKKSNWAPTSALYCMLNEEKSPQQRICTLWTTHRSPDFPTTINISPKFKIWMNLKTKRKYEEGFLVLLLGYRKYGGVTIVSKFV